MTNKRQSTERDKLKMKQWREANKEKMKAYQKIYQKKYKTKKKLENVQVPKKRKKEVIIDLEIVDDEFCLSDLNKDDSFVKKTKVEVYCIKKDEQKINRTTWVNLKTDNLHKTLITFAQSKRLRTYGTNNNNE